MKILNIFKKKSKEPVIPVDAHSLEVFAIKGKEAYIGFKLSNNNFYFRQVPYTESDEMIIIGTVEGSLILSPLDTKETSLNLFWEWYNKTYEK